jgi:hypothetical protein
MPKNYYDPAFDGIWKIQNAVTHSGKPYDGTMTLSPAEHNGHRIDWKTSAGDYDGMGLVIDGRLHLAFGKANEGYGLAVYSEREEGIESIFTSQEFKGALGKEIIPDCKSFEHLNATYNMQGKQPDHISYSGKVGFVGYGDLFLITWGFNNTPGELVGVGMVRHGKLITGYGFRNVYTFGCGCYELLPDGAMQGEWAIPSAQKTIKELYTKHGTAR